MKPAFMPALAIIMGVMLISPASMASSDDVQLAERLQRHHEAPPARPEPEHQQQAPQPEQRSRPPEHAGERGQPDHSHDRERPEHSHRPEGPGQSRQDRSREERGERQQRSGNREQSQAPEDDSRWSTHGAPETGADDDADDDRIYFERYP